MRAAGVFIAYLAIINIAKIIFTFKLEKNF